MSEFGNNLNRVFVENIRDPQLRKEAEERSQAYLKLRVYEDSFLSRVIPSKPISPSQCDRTEESPSLLRKIIDKEYTNVTATVMDFRGKGDYRFVETEQYAVDFHKIESEEYHITEGELRAKEQPVQSLIKHHTARHIQETMDRTFIHAVNAIVAAAEIAAAGTQQVVVDEDIILPNNITKLRNLLDGRVSFPLTAATLLMTQAQFNNIDVWPQAGVDNGMGSEYWRDGYKYDTIFRLRVIKTIKANLIPNNVVYAFVAPEYLGHHLTFNDDRFQIKTEWDDIAWKAWKTHGAAIGNNFGVVRMVLGGASGLTGITWI
jgi:hypothetical protein